MLTEKQTDIYVCTKCESVYSIDELEAIDWKCEDCGGTNFKNIDQVNV